MAGFNFDPHWLVLNRPPTLLPFFPQTDHEWTQWLASPAGLDLGVSIAAETIRFAERSPVTRMTCHRGQSVITLKGGMESTRDKR